MIIKNFSKLAKNTIRADTLRIAEAGYQSLDINNLFEKSCQISNGVLRVGKLGFTIAEYKHIYLVGIGKGSSLAAKTLFKKLPANSITRGVVIDIKKRRIGRGIQCYEGTHPLPSEQNIVATNDLVGVLQSAQSSDLVVCIICGGGSSLSCRPANNMTCTDLQMVGDSLLKSGATIQEINTIRKHLSLIHGGNMAKLAYPASVLSLIISDVPGNEVEMIASGPTVRDSTTVEQADKIAAKFGLQATEFVETPKDKKYFAKVTNHILASGATAVEAMKIEAKALGYHPRVASTKMSGLAKTVGPRLAKAVGAGEAVLACGETQVVVTQPGKGGRNQDLALSALPYLPPNSAIASCASDGKDNIAVAGGITDSEYSKAQLREDVTKATRAVENNHSYATLRRLNGIFRIHKKTANVSDFVVVLRR